MFGYGKVYIIHRTVRCAIDIIACEKNLRLLYHATYHACLGASNEVLAWPKSQVVIVEARAMLPIMAIALIQVRMRMGSFNCTMYSLDGGTPHGTSSTIPEFCTNSIPIHSDSPEQLAR